MRDVAAAVSAKLLTQLKAHESTIEAVNYDFGHPIEIIETLTQKDESATLVYKKYPLIALFTDIPEEKGIVGRYSDAKLSIVVVHHTEYDFKASERLQNIFKPVIHPIVDELMIQLALNPYFTVYNADDIKRTETDRYYWGRQSNAGNTALKFNDYLDATEIEMTIGVNPYCILSNNSSNILK
jgi:hypothetical protein